jgi:UDP-2,3-diacylglucosamine pyrophosphatase LpxH
MNSTQKTVVMSDIHISNGASYSWFQGPYVTYATTMFNRVAIDPNVAELVLLGDIFDNWLYPLNVVPLTTPQIVSGMDAGLRGAIQACVAKLPVVYYMNGNHDMGVQQADLAQLSSGGKQIQWIAADNYNSKHGNARRLEHGNACDMFNAPDAASDTIGGYSLGFFITRLVASSKNQNAAWRKVKNVVDRNEANKAAYAAVSVNAAAMGEAAFPPYGAFLVGLIISALQVEAKVPDRQKIRFAEPALDNQFTVGDIKKHYWSLYDAWVALYPEYLVQTMLAGLLPNGLDWYANLLLSQGVKPPIVMGHTHRGEQNPSGAAGYTNDGCWCNPSESGGGGKGMPTYAEVAGSQATLLTFAP